MNRTAHIERVTRETTIVLDLDLDGAGKTDAVTGNGFFDHMLDQLGRHALFDLQVRAQGDLHIDTHHTIEDTAIAFGTALKTALGDKKGINRFADRRLALDEALVHVAVDLGGRPYLVFNQPEGLAPAIGDYDTTMTQHIWESIAYAAGLCMHIDVIRGRNAHHVTEAQFKAVARTLRDAAARDPRETGIPSTKGVI